MAAQNWIREIRKFLGMRKDYSPSNVPESKYIDAENVRMTDKSAPFAGGLSLTTGNKNALDLENTTNNNYKGYRVVLNIGATDIIHSFTVNGFTYSSIQSTAASRLANGLLPNTNAGRYADLIIQLNIVMSLIVGQVYVQDGNTVPNIVYVGFSFNGGDWILTEYISSIVQVVYVISEYLADNLSNYVVLKSYNYNNNLFILKSNGGALALDCEVKNEVTGIWTKTTVFKTRSIQIATSLKNLIDLAFELDFGQQCSFYISGTPPRSIYVNQSQLGVANSAFIWNENPAYINTVAGNLYGYYFYENVGQETQLQILENFATASFVSMQEGGSLSAGDKMYCVRQLIGTSASSGFNIVSNPINVMSQSLTDTTIHGNTGGYPTSKSITLQINNLNPLLYNKFDLAVIENIDGAITVKRVKTYNITGTSQNVTHYGNEISTNLTIADIVTQQILLLSVGNVVINRNRLFLSDVTLRIDRDLSAFFASTAVSIGTSISTTIPAIGKNYDNVAEYQLSQNVSNKAGYMLNETYRFAVLVIEANGWVNSPYWISQGDGINDWLCQAGGSALLTNITGAGFGVPTSVYVYHPIVTIDYTTAPAINGVPFLQAISAISIVRQKCVPEVLATGYVMPSVYENDTIFTVGDYAAKVSSSLPIPTFSDNKKGGFLSPDIIFNNQQIVYQGSDILKVADNVWYYNQIEKFPSDPLNKVYLNEYATYTGSFSNVPIFNAEEVPFNSVGNIQMNGKVLSTYVSGFIEGCQQKMIAIQTTVPISVSDATVHNGGMYYAQYFRPLVNKYGDTKGGTYISCGHFQLASAITRTGFNMYVYGGDTFVQKNFTKFVNKEVFAVYGIRFSGANVSPFAISGREYVIIAIDGFGVPICQTPIASINIGAGDVNKGILIQWDSVVGAITYQIRHSFPSNPWYIFGTVFAPTTSFLDQNGAAVSTSTPAFPTNYVLSTGLSYYTENRNNYQMRNFPITDNISYPYTTQDINIWLTPTAGNDLIEGTLGYSQSYTPLNNFQTYWGFDPTLPTEPLQPSVLYYSEIKEEGSPHDSYRIVKPLNFKSYSQYGRITNTFIDVNSLILMCVNAILTQQLDLQQQQIDPNGTSIIIGDGTVLGTREFVSSYIGASLKSAAEQYITKAGSKHVVWFNNFKNKVLRRGQDGVRVLSEENFMQTFFSNNNHYIANENDIILGWDGWTQEVLMRAQAVVTGESIWTASTPYNKGDIVKVAQLLGGINGTSYMYKYFKASINVPSTVGSPLTPSNQMNYWEIYRDSNYLISFNETDNINDYGSFYGYTCDNFIPYKDTFLTTYIVSSELRAYEHNINTLSYFPSPFDGSGGIAISGYVTQMFNKNFTIFKILRNVWIQAQGLILTDIHVRGQNGTKTFSIQSEIVEKRPNEGAWWSNVKQDATIGVPVIPSGTNTTGSSDLMTQEVGGQTNTVTIFFTNNNNTVIGGINEVLLVGLPKPTLYNS